MGTTRRRSRSLFLGLGFVPLATATLLGVLAPLLVYLDHVLETESVAPLFGGDASAARSILSTVAGAFATISGVVFSITIVTLQLVSSQFSPRALSHFLEDRITQLAAGAFVGIFVYCLLVLRTVRTGNDQGAAFVPSLAVTVAIGLGIFGLALLLVFMHRISDSIQVQAIIERISKRTLRRIDELYPDPFDPQRTDDGNELLRGWNASAEPQVVRADRPGYVQAVALEQLMEGLTGGSLRLHLPVHPGQFVTEGTIIASIWSPLDAGEVEERTREAIAIGGQRDIRDVAFGLRQLSDIAVRALSPGINDPTTALTSIGYARAVVERLAGRTLPARVRGFPEPHSVAIAERRSFGGYLSEAFADVGRHAARDARVSQGLLEVLERIASVALQAGALGRREDVLALAEAVAEPALEHAASERDRLELVEALGRVRSSALDAPPESLRAPRA